METTRRYATNLTTGATADYSIFRTPVRVIEIVSGGCVRVEFLADASTYCPKGHRRVVKMTSLLAPLG